MKKKRRKRYLIELETTRDYDEFEILAYSKRDARKKAEKEKDRRGGCDMEVSDIYPVKKGN